MKKKILIMLSLVCLTVLLTPVIALAVDYNDADLIAEETGDQILSIPAGTHTITSTGVPTYSLVIECGSSVNLTINNVNINASTLLGPGISFTGTGNQLILQGENVFLGDAGYSGIAVNSGTALSIGGSGLLTATAGTGAAGIGGAAAGDFGDIDITGGNIYASGGALDAHDVGKGSAGASTGSLNISGTTTAVFLHNNSSVAPSNTLNTHEPGGRLSLKNTDLTGGVDDGVISLYGLSGIDTLWENASGGYFQDEVVATSLGYYSDKIVIYFDENLASTYYDTPSTSFFSITKGVTPINVLSAYVSTDRVLLNLDTVLSDTTDLSIIYTPPVLPADNQLRNELGDAVKSFVKYSDDFSFQLVDSSPKDDSIDVTHDTNFILNLEFSGPVTKNIGNVTLFKSLDDSTILTKDVTDVDVVISANTMTVPLTLPTELLLGEEYYILADSTIITTSWNGITDKKSLNFKTSYDATHNFNGKSGVDLANSYEIDTIYELYMMRFSNTNRFYKLTKDLDFTNTAHYGCDPNTLIDYAKTPVDWNLDTSFLTSIHPDFTTGVGFTPIDNFAGTLDGQGYTISGLRISRELDNNIGIFGIASNGTISKIGFLDGTIVGNENVGVILGSGAMSISNCYVDNFSIEAKGSDCGGIVGEYSGVMEDVYISSSLIIGTNNVGGVSGNLLVGGSITSGAAFVSRIEATTANRAVGISAGTLVDVYAYAHMENSLNTLFITGTTSDTNGADISALNNQSILEAVGFDFTSNWEIGVNEDRPTIKAGGADDGLIDWWEQTDIKGFSGCLDTVYIDFINTLIIGDGNTPVTSDFTVMNGASEILVNGVFVAQSRVTLSLADNIPVNSDVLSIEYVVNHTNTKRLTTVTMNIDEFSKTSGFKIVDITPNDERVNVIASENLDFTLSSTPVLNAANFTINNETDTTSESISLTDATQVSILSNTVTINPTVDLLGETNYNIIIDNEAVENTDGVPLPGIDITTAWNFTTLSSNSKLASVEIGVVSDGLSSLEGFSQTTTSYAKEFSSGTSWIFLKPTAVDTKATVLVTGDAGLSIEDPSITLITGVYKISNLVVGSNNTNIRVTAEDGSILDYTLVIEIDGNLSISIGPMSMSSPSATSINPNIDYFIILSHEVTVSEYSSSTTPWNLSITPGGTIENVANTISDPIYAGEYLDVTLLTQDLLNFINIPIINLPPSATDHALNSSIAISTLPKSYNLFNESYLVTNSLGLYSDTGNYILDIEHKIKIPYWLPINTQITSTNTSSRFYNISVGESDKIQFFEGNYRYNFTYNLARNATN